MRFRYYARLRLRKARMPPAASNSGHGTFSTTYLGRALAHQRDTTAAYADKKREPRFCERHRSRAEPG